MYIPSNQHIKYSVVSVFIGFFLLLGCSSTRTARFEAQLKQPPLKNSFHGLLVVDAKTEKVIVDTNSDNYFTPASNVKIFTLYTALKMLPEHIPTLKYVEENDSIFAMGTGDPSWLHPYFKDSTAVNFLKQRNHVALYLNNSEEEKFGPGWAWEDYDSYFSPEKSNLPLFGNVVTLSKTDSLEVSPQPFFNQVTIMDKTVRREKAINQFYINSVAKDTVQVPFITSDSITKKLLEAALGKTVKLIDSFPQSKKEILYGLPSDSIYRRMMHESDNFLAEQLLMVASSTLSDTLSTKKTIAHTLENLLPDLEHQPRWVDGSGLSRYNLFTPKSMVQVLQKLFVEVDRERLFQIFPMWNKTGTVSKWENPESEPYIFAKSGSLGNNYNLSGFLKTKSGKWLMFSFMNNHFTIPTAQIREEIAKILWELHQSH